VTLTNGKIIQGPEVADHAFALLLALTRNLPLFSSENSTSNSTRPIELNGRTAVVIGCGGVGMLVAERARAFGMRVIGVTNDYINIVSFIDKFVLFENLSSALEVADIVFMTAPSTDFTYQCLNERTFQSFKQGSILVNVARGINVDTEDLIQALTSGILIGAGLDVTDPEPLPPDHPLRSFSNVIITPHTAGLSDKNRSRSHALIRDNISRYIQNKPLINQVDKYHRY
jgi:phosphoglycerate dehydrogenase-like enzyme